MDLRVVTIDVARQEVMTRDNVPITVDAVVYFRVSDSSWGLGHFAAGLDMGRRHRGRAYTKHIYLIVTIESRCGTWLDGRPLDSRVVSARCDSEGSPDPIKAQLFREVLA